MLIKNVENNTKKQILDFCKNTFSWGDYIDLVWDFWIDEGNFLCVYDDKTPVGICHVLVSGESKQIWIEGIRVHPKFKRKCLATSLVLESESIGIKNSCNTSFMLIEDTNVASLKLAKNLDYVIDSVWSFYLVHNTTSVSDTDACFVTSIDELSDFISKSLKFVKSWRWYPFNFDCASQLVSRRQVISVMSGSVCSVATMIPSEHFDNTLLVTILGGNQSGINKLVKFIQNYRLLSSNGNNISKIQLLVNNKINLQNDSNSNSFSEKRFVFNLMQKNLV